MDPALLGAVIGLVLVIVELLTGTFYLLMLGVAAFGAAGAAWLGYDFAVQSIVGSVVAAVGCYGVHVYRERNKAEQMAPIIRKFLSPRGEVVVDARTNTLIITDIDQ